MFNVTKIVIFGVESVISKCDKVSWLIIKLSGKIGCCHWKTINFFSTSNHCLTAFPEFRKLPLFNSGNWTLGQINDDLINHLDNGFLVLQTQSKKCPFFPKDLFLTAEKLTTVLTFWINFGRFWEVSYLVTPFVMTYEVGV